MSPRVVPPVGTQTARRTYLRAEPLALAAALLLALPPGAAAKSFRGSTSQHRRASVVVGADGLVQRIRVAYSAPCRRVGRFPNIARFTPPFETGTTEAVTSSGVIHQRLKGGGRTTQTLTVQATRHLDPAHPEAETWSGTFTTRAVLYRRGRWLDTCELKRVTWTAKLVR